MMTYPHINPIAFHLGPLSVHWYGLMYLVGFVGGWSLLALRIRRSPRGFQLEQLSDIFFYGALGIILGGRIGYELFYEFQDFIHAPWNLFAIWRGGMNKILEFIKQFIANP